jgi:hypothetical protein
MKKRLLPLLVVVALFLTLAPAAMANHCTRCGIRAEPHTVPPFCKTNTQFGYLECYPNLDTDSCDQFGVCTHASAAVPLSTEYQVASVERLDTPQTAAAQTLVASLPAPATR